MRVCRLMAEVNDHRRIPLRTEKQEEEQTIEQQTHCTSPMHVRTRNGNWIRHRLCVCCECVSAPTVPGQFSLLFIVRMNQWNAVEIKLSIVVRLVAFHTQHRAHTQCATQPLARFRAVFFVLLIVCLVFVWIIVIYAISMAAHRASNKATRNTRQHTHTHVLASILFSNQFIIRMEI